ncbi:hypothetical protein KKE48_03645 [Patescibacteria group bacterium]|nr:hypothetical protein [Patescibacteria group bacterium]
MPNPEVLYSAGNTIHQLLEARSALTDVNLLHMLQDLGHPYGLIMNFSSQKGIDSSAQSIQSINNFDPFQIYSTSVHSSVVKSMENAGLAYWFSSGPSIESIFHSGYSASSGWSLLTSSVWSLEPERHKPSMGQKISVNKFGISLGTVSANLKRYSGHEPFIVKSPQGESVAEIQPDSPLAFLHLNRQPGVLRQMSPLERIQTMIQDMKNIFGLMDSEELLNSLKPEQQAVLTAAQSAVIVGISHLVPLFRRKTGLPFWKLDVLPQVVQQLHRLDSQAVSNQFGGHREVKVEDVEMMMITPQMRQQLVAAYA